MPKVTNQVLNCNQHILRPDNDVNRFINHILLTTYYILIYTHIAYYNIHVCSTYIISIIFTNAVFNFTLPLKLMGGVLLFVLTLNHKLPNSCFAVYLGYDRNDAMAMYPGVYHSLVPMLGFLHWVASL